MGNKANKPPRRKRGAQSGKAGGARVDRSATSAPAFDLVMRSPEAAQTSDLTSRLTSAILVNDVGLVETYALDLLELGVEIFRMSWRPLADGGSPPATLDIFDLSLRSGATDCFVWLMRAGINLKEPSALDTFDELQAQIEQRPAPEFEGDVRVELFKAILRPQSLADAQDMATSPELAEKLGPRSLLIWREMIDAYIAAEEKALLALSQPPSSDGEVATTRGPARL